MAKDKEFIRLLAVAPYFFVDDGGGAERVIQRFVYEWHHLPEIDLEVWASGSTSLHTWNNNALHRKANFGNLNVKVFPANVGCKGLCDFLHRQLNRGARNPLLEYLWIQTAITGRGMDRELRARKAEFDVIYLPHCFYGSTHRLAPIAGKQAILHPFFHDEPALKNNSVKKLFATVGKVMLNTSTEEEYVRSSFSVPDQLQFCEIGNIVDRSAELDWNVV
ncbi:MAG: hypothetical protein K5905_29175 [Roseibium sp.]|uniref:hypothetical protein n=1 Tax=Roseibium sp. TaxID=1936156 RepID=UPI00260F5A43|nr:hypothetical protein [Roseibium sp.]MCV0429532.1 hypothetical protein [Roseibium sp.]